MQTAQQLTPWITVFLMIGQAVGVAAMAYLVVSLKALRGEIFETGDQRWVTNAECVQRDGNSKLLLRSTEDRIVRIEDKLDNIHLDFGERLARVEALIINGHGKKS